ncbi:MAG: carbohydrate kinase [Propionibacteriales bacterium]|nr:carbohydrate kinase [Propionibacteriales bacterium]
MIVVAGEALVDLVVEPSDPEHPVAHPGGSPANVAVTLARLGSAVSFVGRSSGDAFGRLTRDHLAHDKVDLRHLVEAAEPASLAVVSVGADGGAEYSFHVAGTADWGWCVEELPGRLDADVTAIHAGSLAMVLPPGGDVLTGWIERRDPSVTFSLDPNVRPALVGDRAAYQKRLERWVSMSDLVKVSAEDLAWVYPGLDPLATAARWATQEAAPRLVVVTFGVDGVLAHLGTHPIRRPSPEVKVVDTVGAGDAFSGGLLDWLDRQDRLRPDALARLTADEAAAAVDFAARVAAVTCSRPGADPPYRHDLDPSS